MMVELPEIPSSIEKLKSASRLPRLLGGRSPDLKLIPNVNKTLLESVLQILDLDSERVDLNNGDREKLGQIVQFYFSDDGISNPTEFNNKVHDGFNFPNAAALRIVESAWVSQENSQVIALNADLGSLKRINRVSRDLGDIYIKHGAKILNRVVGQLARAYGCQAFVARLGGDEFRILLNLKGTKVDPSQLTEEITAKLHVAFEQVQLPFFNSEDTWSCKIEKAELQAAEEVLSLRSQLDSKSQSSEQSTDQNLGAQQKLELILIKTYLANLKTQTQTGLQLLLKKIVNKNSQNKLIKLIHKTNKAKKDESIRQNRDTQQKLELIKTCLVNAQSDGDEELLLEKIANENLKNKLINLIYQTKVKSALLGVPIVSPPKFIDLQNADKFNIFGVQGVFVATVNSKVANEFGFEIGDKLILETFNFITEFVRKYLQDSLPKSTSQDIENIIKQGLSIGRKGPDLIFAVDQDSPYLGLLFACLQAFAQNCQSLNQESPFGLPLNFRCVRDLENFFSSEERCTVERNRNLDWCLEFLTKPSDEQFQQLLQKLHIWIYHAYSAKKLQTSFLRPDASSTNSNPERLTQFNLVYNTLVNSRYYLNFHCLEELITARLQQNISDSQKNRLLTVRQKLNLWKVFVAQIYGTPDFNEELDPAKVPQLIN